MKKIGYDQYDTHILQCQYTCEHCNRKYLRSDTDQHEANCIDLIKFKNLGLSTKLEESKAKVATARAELESINSQFKNVTIFPAGFKYFENGVLVTKLKQARMTSFDKKGHDSRNNFDWFRSDSAKEQFTGAKIYVKHQHGVFSDKKEDRIALFIERSEITETIEAMWNLKVFHNGKKLLDDDLEYTFEKDKGWGTDVKKNCDESEFCVIVTIKGWKVQPPLQPIWSSRWCNFFA